MKINEVDADVIFVKNIDNVVPDRLKSETVEWKQVIAGILVSLQKQAFKYLEVLEKGSYNRADLDEMASFVRVPRLRLVRWARYYVFLWAVLFYTPGSQTFIYFQF